VLSKRPQQLEAMYRQATTRIPSPATRAYTLRGPTSSGSVNVDKNDLSVDESTPPAALFNPHEGGTNASNDTFFDYDGDGSDHSSASDCVLLDPSSFQVGIGSRGNGKRSSGSVTSIFRQRKEARFPEPSSNSVDNYIELDLSEDNVLDLSTPPHGNEGKSHNPWMKTPLSREKYDCWQEVLSFSSEAELQRWRDTLAGCLLKHTGQSKSKGTDGKPIWTKYECNSCVDNCSVQFRREELVSNTYYIYITLPHKRFLTELICVMSFTD
jgi:hypothetical protein